MLELRVPALLPHDSLRNNNNNSGNSNGTNSNSSNNNSNGTNSNGNAHLVRASVLLGPPPLPRSS